MSDGENDGPLDPISAMAQAAAAMHELYESYREAGFTEGEAIKLIAAIVIGQQGV